MKTFESIKRIQIAMVAMVLLVSAPFTHVASAADEKLVFAVDLIRHGDRTPLRNIAKFPHHWAEGLGQLTARGMQQEFQLGTRMRKLYVDQAHLLPSNYVAAAIYVRSTDVDRTLMSAQAVLTGLYPNGVGPTVPESGLPALPNAAQPIPIHTSLHADDHLLVPDYGGQKYDTLLERYVFSTPEWKAKTAELEAKFPLWSDETGVKITNLSQLESLADSFLVYQLYHVPLPKEIENDARAMTEAGLWVFVQGYKPREIGQLGGNALLKKIADYFQQASGGRSSLRYVLYSAHDSTLLTEMSALGDPLTEPPPYASDLRFTLWKADDGGFRVDVRYNEKPVFMQPLATNSCSLAQFELLVKGTSPQKP